MRRVFFGICFLGTISIFIFTPNFISHKQAKAKVKSNKILDVDEIFNYTMVDFKNPNLDDTKHILFFSSLWGMKNWRMSAETIDKDSPELRNCSFNNCVFTNNRHDPKPIHEYDALFFHQSVYSWSNRSNYIRIETRSPHQLYILCTQEYFH
jgi:hypothetical protein